MEQLQTQFAAADVVLADALLDRIGEIVPPGTALKPADSSFDNLRPSAVRRRTSPGPDCGATCRPSSRGR
jgi:hypothetical protein